MTESLNGTRVARELMELEARTKPLTDKQLKSLDLEKARDYYDAQCEVSATHLRLAGQSAFQIGRVLSQVNEMLGRSRKELEAWLSQSKHPRSVSGAYQYIKLYEERGKLEKEGLKPEEISFRAARAILTEPRPALLPKQRKARNKTELEQQKKERDNIVTRIRDMLAWLKQFGEPTQVKEVAEFVEDFLREIRSRGKRAKAVAEEE